MPRITDEEDKLFCKTKVCYSGVLALVVQRRYYKMSEETSRFYMKE